MTAIPLPITPKQHKHNPHITTGVLIADAQAEKDQKTNPVYPKFESIWTTSKKTWNLRCQNQSCNALMYTPRGWWKLCITVTHAESREDRVYHHTHPLDHLFCVKCWLQLKEMPLTKAIVMAFRCDRDPSPTDVRKLESALFRLQHTYFYGPDLTPQEEKALNAMVEPLIPKSMEETRSKMALAAKFRSRQTEARNKARFRPSLKINNPPVAAKKKEQKVEVTMSIDTSSSLADEKDPTPIQTVLTFLKDINQMQEDYSDLEPYTPPAIERRNGYMKVPPPSPEKASQQK